mgnify:CR=1 FL=1
MKVLSKQFVQRSLIGAAVASASLMALAGTAGAATSSGNVTANVSVTNAITLSGLTPAFTLMGAPGATVTDTSAVAFNVLTNDLAGYNVTVQSNGTALAPTAVGNTDSIPMAALTVSNGGANTFASISNVPDIVWAQGTRSASTGDNHSNDYKMLIPFVNSDTYTTTLNYVATAQ